MYLLGLEEGMKTNQGPKIITEQAVDYGRLRAVLSEWGYAESEIDLALTATADRLENKHDEDDDSVSFRRFHRPSNRALEIPEG